MPLIGSGPLEIVVMKNRSIAGGEEENSIGKVMKGKRMANTQKVTTYIGYDYENQGILESALPDTMPRWT